MKTGGGTGGIRGTQRREATTARDRRGYQAMTREHRATNAVARGGTRQHAASRRSTRHHAAARDSTRHRRKYAEARDSTYQMFRESRPPADMSLRTHVHGGGTTRSRVWSIHSS